ncbi:hypothetical protein ACHAQA_008624 [Verticillium albo-atrum]
MQHRLFAFLALALLGAHLAAAGFLDKCGRLSGDQWILSTDGHMGTYCSDDNCESSEFTVLNLNECFSNKDGELVHNSSCRDCRVIDDMLAYAYVDTWNGYLRCNDRISHYMEMSY